LGFLARASSWVGLVLGLFIAVRELPAAIRLLDGSTPASRLMVAAIVLVGGSLAGQALGLIVGSRIRSVLPLGPLSLVDKGAGAAAGAVGVLAAFWLLVPAMADSSPSVSREVRNSVIARALDSHLPRPPDTLQALRRLVGARRFPSVFDALRPAAAAGPPPAASALVQRVVGSPPRVQQKVDAVGRDLYDSPTTHRDVFILASVLHPGDSGGALVDHAGAVIGVASAIAPDRPGTAYALTTREVTADLSRPRAGAVATGPCLAD